MKTFLHLFLNVFDLVNSNQSQMGNHIKWKYSEEDPTSWVLRVWIEIYVCEISANFNQNQKGQIIENFKQVVSIFFKWKIDKNVACIKHSGIWAQQKLQQNEVAAKNHCDHKNQSPDCEISRINYGWFFMFH